MGALEVTISSIKLRYLYVLGSVKDYIVHVLGLAILSRIHPLVEIRIVSCMWVIKGS
jgi:hypothetical protein